MRSDVASNIVVADVKMIPTVYTGSLLGHFKMLHSILPHFLSLALRFSKPHLLLAYFHFLSK